MWWRLGRDARSAAGCCRGSSLHPKPKLPRERADLYNVSRSIVQPAMRAPERGIAIYRIVATGAEIAACGLRSRLVALLCLLALLMPMLPPAAAGSFDPIPEAFVGVDGFDAGAKLAVDSVVAEHPALLAKRIVADGSETRRSSPGGGDVPPALGAATPEWNPSTVRGPPLPRPVLRTVDAGILQSNRTPTGPPTATA